VRLLLLLLPPDLAPVGEKQELPQRVQGLALVELGVDPAPELLALQVTQDEDGLHQAAVLLQGTGQGVLAAVRLEPAD
jgi:hypothetical protein